MTADAASTVPPPPPELARVVDARPLPVPLQPPLRCAALGDRLHVVGRDPAGDGVLRLLFDAAGEPEGEVARLPLRVAALAPSAEGLIATGSRTEGGGPPLVVALDPAGTVRWRHELTIEQPLTGFPVPVSLSVEGYIALAWLSGTKDPTLHVAAVVGDDVRPVTDVPLDGVTVDFDVDGSGGALTFARVAGYPQRLEVLRPSDQPERQLLPGAERPETASVAAVGDGTLVAWTEMGDGRVRLQRLDRELSPVGSPAVIVEVEPPARLREVRFVRGGPRRLAVRYRVGRPAADRILPEATPGGLPRREPGEAVEQIVAAIDPRSGQTGGRQRVGESGLGFDAAAWVGARLMVTHGTREPLLTVFEARVGSAPGSG